MTDSTQVMLDLDALEREQVRGIQEKKPPYAIKFEGRILTFKDPMDIDAVLLMTMEETPNRFFRTTLSNEDYLFVADLLATPGKVPAFKLRALMTSYHTYYGLDEAGNGGGSQR